MQAVDLDDGNGDSIRFSVADKDNSTFSIDTVTGDLYSKINLVYTTNYSITVLATDTNGTGLQSSATFQVTYLHQYFLTFDHVVFLCGLRKTFFFQNYSELPS